MSLVYYIGSDTTIWFKNFRDENTGAKLTGKTITWTLINDKTDTVLTSGSMTEDPDNQADYFDNLPYNISGVTLGMRLRLEIFADGGPSLRLTQVIKGVADQRTG